MTNKKLEETFEKYKVERDLLDNLHVCDDEGFGCENEDFFVDGQRYTRCKLKRENWNKLKTLLRSQRTALIEEVLKQETHAGDLVDTTKVVPVAAIKKLGGQDE